MELKECVDTVISIPNEKLLHTVERGTSLTQAFGVADDVLRQAVQGISDLITIPGVINLDFADVKTVMCGMGMALMGTGISEGPNRATEAAQKAISSPLLEETSIMGARAVLINITGGSSMALHEVCEAAKIIQEAADPDANIIFGSVFDDLLEDTVKITVIATGFEQRHEQRLVTETPQTIDVVGPNPAIPCGELGELGDMKEHTMSEATGTDGEELDIDVALIKEDIDIPAFLRKKAN